MYFIFIRTSDTRTVSQVWKHIQEIPVTFSVTYSKIDLILSYPFYWSNDLDENHRTLVGATLLNTTPLVIYDVYSREERK